MGSNHRTCGPNHRAVIISELGRFAGSIGSRARVADDSGYRYRRIQTHMGLRMAAASLTGLTLLAVGPR